MKIIILGAGGIGSMAGALLSRENDVLLVGREAHADKINKDGLKISGCINKNFKVKAATEIVEMDEGTLVILCTKVVDSEAAIKKIRHLIKKNNIILCLQNGLGSEDIVKGIVKCKVIRGITTAGTTFLEAGKVSCSNIGDIFIKQSDVSEKICRIFKKAGLPAQVDKNIKERIWKKTIVNCVMNPLTAIFGVKNGALLKDTGLIMPIIDELLAVAEKEDLKFDRRETFSMVIKIIKDSAENKSSMLQDILKGKKTEVNFLNGKIIELAEKHKINVPANKMLFSMVKFLENDKPRAKK